MLIDNIEVKQLNLEKAELMRKYDKHLVTDEEYNKRMAEITEQLKSKINIVVDNEKLKSTEDKTMEEEVKSKKKEKKEKKETRVDFILRALQLKTVKSVADVVKKVCEWRPNENPKLVGSQTRKTIDYIKKGKGKLACYTFNEKDFTVTAKE